MLSKDSDIEDCEVDILDLTSMLHGLWDIVWHMLILELTFQNLSKKEPQTSTFHSFWKA